MRLCLTLVLMMMALLPIISKAQSPVGNAQMNVEERQALTFVTKFEAELEKATQKYSDIQWAYATNITDYNEKNQLEYQVYHS
jgi:hypothetical protein